MTYKNRFEQAKAAWELSRDTYPGSSSRTDLADAMRLSCGQVQQLLRQYRRTNADSYEWPISRRSALRLAALAKKLLADQPPMKERAAPAFRVDSDRLGSSIQFSWVTVTDDGGQDLIVAAPQGYSNQVRCFGSVSRERRG